MITAAATPERKKYISRSALNIFIGRPIITRTKRFQAIGQPIPGLPSVVRWPSSQEYPTISANVA